MRTGIWISLTLFVAALPLAAQEEAYLPKPPDTGWWAGEGKVREGGLKAALLIGVGRHALDRSRFMGWDLEFVEKDVSDMKAALEKEAGFSYLRVLEDEHATLSKIEGFITSELPARIKGGGNLLIIYFSGHGVVQDGQRSWFTYFTDYKGERYSKLLTSSMLMTWIADLKEKCDIHVGLVMDSCATKEKAPGHAPKELTLGDERIFASPQGEMTSASVFTRAFLRAMENLKDRDYVYLKDVYQLVHAELERKNLTLPDREPEVEQSLMLVNRTGLRCTLRTVDSLTPSVEIMGAKIFYEDLQRETTPQLVTDLKPGRYPLLVEKPGYLNTRVIVDLDIHTSGGVYEIPMIPAYKVLAGRVQRKDGTVPDGVQVEVLGSHSGWRKGFHTQSTGLHPTGAFGLLVPPEAEVSSIKITGLDKPLVEDVAYDSLSEQNILLPGKNRISIFSLDPIVLAGHTLAEGELQMDRASRTLYLEAQSLAATGRVQDCRSAAFTFMGVWLAVDDPATKTTLEMKIRDSLSTVFRSLMAEENYEEGLKLCTSIQKQFPDDPGLQEWTSRFAKENIPADLREIVEEAGKAIDSKDLKKAVSLYRQIKVRQKELTPFYRDKIVECLQTVREELFIESYSRMITAQKNGDMVQAAAHFETAEFLAPEAYKWTMQNLKDQFVQHLDAKPPVLVLTSPRGGKGTAAGPTFTLKGEVSDDKGLARVTVDGVEVALSGGETTKAGFSHKVELKKGNNSFQIEVFDRRGLTSKATAEVIYTGETVAKGFVFLKELSFTTGGRRHTMKIFRHEATGLEFVLVPGGKFMMGSPDGEEDREADEGPRHEVTIQQFLLCRTEVPQIMWQRATNSSPWRQKKEVWDNPFHPATYISFKDCVAFCKRTGLRFPSEAEWEYACRAGTETRFCFGDEDSGLQNYAWFQANTIRNKEGYPHRIGNKKPNAFGIYDMHGNVWEWCMDAWHGDYTGAPGDGSAWTDPPSEFQVIRGGSYSHTAGRCRSAYRVRLKPDTKNSNVGFRPAFTLPETQ